MIVLVRGDITETECEALVTAANHELGGGGGVDGAVHRAAGPGLLELLQAYPKVGWREDVPGRRVPVAEPGVVRCLPGEAVITPVPSGGRLRCRSVVHAVGPVYKRDENAHMLLSEAYDHSFQLAWATGHRSIALPAISCGVYGFPVYDAAEIAVDTARFWSPRFDRIEFVMFTAECHEEWAAAIAREALDAEGGAS